jgi:protocatechuate 3,4-dioxygenase beta subunit
LSSIEDEGARRSLLARREAGAGPRLYRFDILLQGDNETAFLDI